MQMIDICWSFVSYVSLNSKVIERYETIVLDIEMRVLGRSILPLQSSGIFVVFFRKKSSSHMPSLK